MTRGPLSWCVLSAAATSRHSGGSWRRTPGWRGPALGDRATVDEFLAASPPPASSDIDEAFWQACHGGQRRMAEYLLAQGADINVIPEYSEQTALQAAGAADTMRQSLVDWLTEHDGAQG